MTHVDPQKLADIQRRCDGILQAVTGSGAFVAWWRPDREPSALGALQLGFAVLTDRPIITVVDPADGQRVPGSLRQLGWVVEADLSTDAGHDELAATMRALLANAGTTPDPIEDGEEERF